MQSSLTFIKNATITTLILYVIFSGLLAILAAIGWVTWDFVGEWAGRIGLVTLLILVLTAVVSFLVGLIKK